MCVCVYVKIVQLTIDFNELNRGLTRVKGIEVQFNRMLFNRIRKFEINRWLSSLCRSCSNHQQVESKRTLAQAPIVKVRKIQVTFWHNLDIFIVSYWKMQSIYIRQRIRTHCRGEQLEIAGSPANLYILIDVSIWRYVYMFIIRANMFVKKSNRPTLIFTNCISHARDRNNEMFLLSDTADIVSRVSIIDNVAEAYD